MLRRALVFLLGILAAAGSPAAAGAQSREVKSDQQILIQIERDWDAAHRGRNPDFIKTILADEFVAVYSDGTRGDKAHELALAANFNQQVESSTLDDFDVKIYGETAIVRMRQTAVGVSQGSRVTLTFRYVDVFVLRDGRWQCVSSQSTKVAAP
jgi:ketosteroid isomerase-like protein